MVSYSHSTQEGTAQMRQNALEFPRGSQRQMCAALNLICACESMQQQLHSKNLAVTAVLLS